MTPDAIDDMLRQTIDDQRLSRGEKKALRAVLDELGRDQQTLAQCRSRAFELVRTELVDPRNGALLDWLEELVKLLKPAASSARSARHEVLFSPRDPCPERICRLFAEARRRVAVCVFTITDDRIASAMLDAHERGVEVRVISDDDKAGDRGSDIDRLAARGMAVRVDRSPDHMHHKFAVFDDALVLTGSYNWTRSAANRNQENFLISDDARLVSSFTRGFEELWKALAL